MANDVREPQAQHNAEAQNQQADAPATAQNRRDFLRVSVYTAPLLVPLLVMTSNKAQAATVCSPNACTPNTCTPFFQCTPKPCSPVINNCGPLNP